MPFPRPNLSAEEKEHVILLVEDSADDVRLIQRAMKKAGIGAPVHVVQDGDAAVAYLDGAGAYSDRAAHPAPSLVLLDLKLPRRSGFDVLAHLRAHPVHARTIVVVLTSSRQRADIDRAYEAGANSYLVKPIRPEDMNRLFETLHVYWLHTNEPPSGMARAP